MDSTQPAIDIVPIPDASPAAEAAVAAPPVVEEPAALPAPVVEEPAALPAPVEEPAAEPAPVVVEEPAALPAPVEEPAAEPAPVVVEEPAAVGVDEQQAPPAVADEPTPAPAIPEATLNIPTAEDTQPAVAITHVPTADGDITSVHVCHALVSLSVLYFARLVLHTHFCTCFAHPCHQAQS